MRDADFEVDCEFFTVTWLTREGIGGQSIRVKNPACLLEGTANNPPSMDRPFRENCAECEHNAWGKKAP